MFKRVGKGSVVFIDKIMNKEAGGGSTQQEKVLSLFKFIEELNKLKQNLVLNVSQYKWWRPINSFPDDPENIKIYYRDRVDEGEEGGNNNILFSVHKPEFQICPEPGIKLKEWLEQGWNDYRKEVKTKEFISRPLDLEGLSSDEEKHVPRIDRKKKNL
ncbi:hypothetical protein QO008_000841 [Peptoniphilus ivorii]|uniref:hypothetical protein n=1 Tax=Aedoeadaptatus ivorii TaxID=54006 RepID=UPI00277D8DFD|nr:hypothetical protein [Peptoniphilus ivorii]MDQ0508386.1 hypothetical protein [Peptoniphilus ivorii]